MAERPEIGDMPRYDGLRAVVVNCTLKPSPALSHTDGLMSVVSDIMKTAGCSVETIRAVDHVIAPGVQPDMTEHGASRDDWPDLAHKILEADILVLGTPIWLGEPSSVCRRVIERLYALSGWKNDKGQSIYYGKAAGVVITGNEDGVKHCASGMLYALGHLGYMVPPQADAGWIGEIGPGPSYCDEGSGAGSHPFTQRNATILAWNMMHTANMLKQAGGLPNYGNDRDAFDDGASFGHPNPEYR
ncbi:MAG: flavodoxin family protein [Pseudomonadota bacterium]|nr:flavodoxin family protein [Pseudomonadota bacterium]